MVLPSSNSRFLTLPSFELARAWFISGLSLLERSNLSPTADFRVGILPIPEWMRTVGSISQINVRHRIFFFLLCFMLALGQSRPSDLAIDPPLRFQTSEIGSMKLCLVLACPKFPNSWFRCFYACHLIRAKVNLGRRIEFGRGSGSVTQFFLGPFGILPWVF